MTTSRGGGRGGMQPREGEQRTNRKGLSGYEEAKEEINEG